VRVAVVGCGTIAPAYVKTMRAYPQLELVGAFDLVPERARTLLGRRRGRVYESLAEVLADDGVDAVLNLTVHHVHAEVVRACLEAGKHVHTEKPLALGYEEARALAELSERTGIRLSCAPINFLGEAQQTTWKLVRDGSLGRVRVAYAEANWGRIERWHPAPVPFYEAGPLFDVGVYPLTLLAAIFGRFARVTAYGRVVEAERRTRAGEEFRVTTPDFVVALAELAEGPVVRLTATFYADKLKQRGLELHGDRASAFLDSWENFDSQLELAVRGGAYEPVPLVRDGFPGKDWARSLAELDDAITEGRPHRPSAQLAAHVVEVMEGIARSARTGEPVEIEAAFDPSPPMPWAV
jgi:predicted dehydrogenase